MVNRDLSTWNPVLQGVNNRLRVEEKLRKIAWDLEKLILHEPTYGLYHGTEGIILFYIYYARFTDDEAYLYKAINLLENLFNGLKHNYFSFAGGLAGLCWLINHICENEFVKCDTDNVVGELDDYLYESMMEEIAKGNYDFLHGALGVGWYFLSRSGDNSSKANMGPLLDKLIKIGTEDMDGSFKWYAYRNSNVMREYVDLGLAHGMPGIISFLSKTKKVGINHQHIDELIFKSCVYMLKQKLSGNFFFPYSSIANHVALHSDDSRLAWCYGDLGVCISLWHAAEALCDKDLKEEVKQMLCVASKRRDLDSNKVWDASFCHGTAGIAHIFLRMYNYTGLEELRDASEYWYDQTFKMGHFTDNKSGFKCFNPRVKTYYENLGLIEGITGTGLALIASVSDHPPLWDECLMLS